MSETAQTFSPTVQSFSVADMRKERASFGNGSSWKDLKLYSGFLVIQVPNLKLTLRYSQGGFAASRAKALEALTDIAERRNNDIKSEKTSVDVENLKFDVMPDVVDSDRMLALKKLPKGLSAEELGDGVFGRILHESISSLLDESESIEDINLILT